MESDDGSGREILCVCLRGWGLMGGVRGRCYIKAIPSTTNVTIDK